MKQKKLVPAGSARRHTALDFALGAAIGMAFFIVVYGVSTLNVTYDSWIYCGYIEGDIIQRYAGWLYFRASPWEFPVLTVANNLSVPYGGSITFTDSVPLVAVVCKLFAPILPATFQYIGWVNFINCVLQGGFAMLLLRRFGLNRVLSGISSLFFVCAPIFVERLFRHDALAAQWMILAALLFYFKARHTGKVPVVGFFVLCTLAPAITTYYLPMVYAILLAALLEYAFKQKKWGRAALYLLACFAGTLAVAYPCGLLTRGGSGSTEGFGRHSLNLNGLFNPSSLDMFAEDQTLHWSRILPLQSRYFRQYEGFNYLGAGILLGLCVLLVFGAVKAVRALAKKDYGVFTTAKAFIKSHVWLIAVCGCLTLFAISNVVTYGENTLFTVPLPSIILQFCGIFRASGRMFWPCYYLLVLCVVLWCARVLQKHWRVVAIVFLLALQLFDISSVLVQKHNYFAAGPLEVQNEFTTEGWRFLAENYDYAECLGNMFDYDLGAGLIRYNPNMQTNMVLTNRGSFPIIERSYLPTIEWLRSGEPLPDGTLYLCSDASTFNYILEGAHPAARGYNTGHYYAIANPVPGCPLPEYLPLSAAA